MTEQWRKVYKPSSWRPLPTNWAVETGYGEFVAMVLRESAIDQIIADHTAARDLAAAVALLERLQAWQRDASVEMSYQPDDLVIPGVSISLARELVLIHRAIDTYLAEHATEGKG